MSQYETRIRIISPILGLVELTQVFEIKPGPNPDERQEPVPVISVRQEVEIL